jgi:drug/metabolite transporter (DMT)-like permease
MKTLVRYIVPVSSAVFLMALAFGSIFLLLRAHRRCAIPVRNWLRRHGKLQAIILRAHLDLCTMLFFFVTRQVCGSPTNMRLGSLAPDIPDSMYSDL